MTTAEPQNLQGFQSASHVVIDRLEVCVFAPEKAAYSAAPLRHFQGGALAHPSQKYSISTAERRRSSQCCPGRRRAEPAGTPTGSGWVQWMLQGGWSAQTTTARWSVHHLPVGLVHHFDHERPEGTSSLKNTVNKSHLENVPSGTSGSQRTSY